MTKIISIRNDGKNQPRKGAERMCTATIHTHTNHADGGQEGKRQDSEPTLEMDLKRSRKELEDRCLRRFVERTRYQDQVPISRASGNARDHETLYQLDRKTWVLHRQYLIDGFYPRFVEIDRARAAAWLEQNGYELPEELDFPATGSR